MNDNSKEKTGIQLLIEESKKKFRISENLDYYSKEDYQIAERKFLKFCILNGQCGFAPGDQGSTRLHFENK
ncbi:MAG: hypothetical protein JSW39_29370 [Desulfobacterales bacterium]|nr:MAG: hypothetical protein JSW39_29370 [Desulfobacterales bacterium]